MRAKSSSTLVEMLESRVMLSTAPSVADQATVSSLRAAGYTPITWQGQQEYAKPGRWIMQVNGVTGKAQDQLTQINGLLSHSPNGIRAIQHLGSDGLVLIEAPSGMSHGQLQSAVRGMDVRYVEPDLALWTAATVPDDSSFSSQWAIDNTGQTGGTPDADIDAPEAWDIARGDGSIVVGVIDTGVDYTHPDLAANIWTNPGEIPGNGIDDDHNGYIDDVHGYDFVNNDGDPMDDHGHGTHTSGTIAAMTNNGVGVAGVAWNAKVMALKFLGSNGSGTTSAAVAAVNYATMMRTTYGVNIRITSNSWGGGGYSTALYAAIQNSGSNGMLFVAAAGNASSNTDTASFYPADYDLPNIISVAATDANDQLATFSNYGLSTVDLAAPGVSILSTTLGGGYGLMSGTSMATPNVTGVAVLAWTPNPNASMANVRAAILRGADPEPSLAGKMASGGRLNAYNTLLQIQEPAPTAPPVAPNNLSATLNSAQIDLAWTQDWTDADGITILRSTDGTVFQQIGTTGIFVTHFSDPIAGLLPGTTYYYVVQAYNAAGSSGFSNVASATTAPANTIPVAPSNVTAAAASPTKVVLSWKDNSNNESGFKIERSTYPFKSWTQIGTVGANVATYTDAATKKNTAYQYRVRAYNSTGNSSYSNTASVTTPFTATATSYPSVSLSAASPIGTTDASVLLSLFSTNEIIGRSRDDMAVLLK